MRLILKSMLIASGIAAFGPAAGHAQSAYDYPWCAVYTNRSGAQACYYATYAQCMATMDGIGGFCMRSPYYRGPERAPPRYSRYE